VRQIVSLIKDNQAHYALVDEDDGSLVPFADLLIPDPDRFGLHESAVLGTNLINALGLNGSKRPKAAEVSLAHVPPTHREEPAALPAGRTETPREKRNRLAREKYHHQKEAYSASVARQRPPIKGSNTSGKGGAERYVTLDEVVAVVNQYPEGITTAQIAERVWRQDTGGTGDMPDWYKMSVGNRQTSAEIAWRDKGRPLPYRIEFRAKIGQNGLPTKLQEKTLLPLQAADGAVSEPETDRGEVTDDA
jgi:hypothetical protein